ncbi:VanZ family protein [Nocardioides hwasunensis]|uniref:VanZ family protein n=1 Tax=Nocardioides hwasunensis TaxID=397258 RepID=A0ABR8MG61_9ACTN|nr:VanZ family protein [Nocardioides hwasunensis]MBD3914868.1 VanZ family protein [Nocardioides hwasunensis]
MLDDDVWRYLPLGPVPTLVVATVGLAAAVHVAVVRSRVTRALTIAMLVVTVKTILALTARGVLSNEDGEFSWRLGETIRGEWGSVNRALGLVNIFGNVAMFVPVGWLIAVLSARRPVLVATLAGLVFSTSTEVWQMLSGMFGDVDDILLNTLGALLGAAVAAFLKSRAVRRPEGDPDARSTGMPVEVTE